MSVDECPKSFCSYWAAVNMTTTRKVIGWNGNIHPGFFLKCSQNAEKETKRWWNLRAKAQSACGVDGSDSPVWQEPSRDPSCYSWPKAWPGPSDLFLRDHWVCFYWAGLDPKESSDARSKNRFSRTPVKERLEPLLCLFSCNVKTTFTAKSVI